MARASANCSRKPPPASRPPARSADVCTNGDAWNLSNTGSAAPAAGTPGQPFANATTEQGRFRMLWLAGEAAAARGFAVGVAGRFIVLVASVERALGAPPREPSHARPLG